MKERIGKLHFIEVKNFHFIKDTANRMRRQATDLEKILAKICQRLVIPNMQRTLITEQ